MWTDWSCVRGGCGNTSRLEGRAISSMLESMEISVIIPVHNGGEAFRRCLLALTETEPAPSEIIVLVDSGTDNSGAQVPGGIYFCRLSAGGETITRRALVMFS